MFFSFCFLFIAFISFWNYHPQMASCHHSSILAFQGSIRNMPSIREQEKTNKWVPRTANSQLRAKSEFLETYEKPWNWITWRLESHSPLEIILSQQIFWGQILGDSWLRPFQASGRCLDLISEVYTQKLQNAQTESHLPKMVSGFLSLSSLTFWDTLGLVLKEKIMCVHVHDVHVCIKI